jgi:hypothetical protein
MQKKTTSLVIGSIVAILATVFALTSVQNNAESQEPQVVSAGGIGYVAGQDAFLGHGGKAAIIVTTPQQIFEAKRGQDLDVTISITHKAGNNALSAVNVVFNGVRNSLILPSAVLEHTPQERADEMRDGKPVTGLVALDPFVSYSPAKLTISAGQTANVTMHIHIPNLPDEMVGKHVRFVPNVVDPSQDFTNIGTFPDMVTVKVIS